MDHKIELFRTVADIFNRGDIELSASDRSVIESQTQDLIRKSMFRRSAVKMPEDFEGCLAKLRNVEDPEEAFDLMVEFMKEKGMLSKEDKGEAKEELKEIDKKKDIEEGAGELEGILEELEGKEEELEKGDKEELKKIMSAAKLILGEEDKKEEKEEKEEIKEEKKEKKEEEGLEKKVKDLKKIDEKSEDRDEDEVKKLMGKARKYIIALARIKSAQAVQDMSTPPPVSTPPMLAEEEEDEKDRDKKDKDKPKLDKDKDEDDKEDKMKKLRELKEEDKKMPTVDEMGLDREQLIRAKKSKIVITKEGNIAAHHEDHGPMFFGLTNKKVKADKKALAKLANKVKSVIIRDGWSKAAELCGSRLLKAGVDEDIETTGGEVLPVDEPVTGGGDTDSREELDKGESDVLKEMDTDTEEKPTVTKVSLKEKVKERKSKEKTVARYKKLGGIEDDIEVVTEEKPEGIGDARDMSVTDESDTDTKEEPDKPEESSLDEAEVDFKTAELEDNYKKLYQARAEKLVQEQVEKFAHKFSKCVRIASARMKLNHYPNSYKVAMADVLAANEGAVEFSDGEIYTGMDQRTAVELIELIAQEGHDSFVEDLLSKAADLLEKDDSYLNDVQKDIEGLFPTPVETNDNVVASRDSRSMREKLSSGNFNVKTEEPVSIPHETNFDEISNALTSTKLGRQLGDMRK